MRTNCFSLARSFLILSLLWVVVFGSSNAVAGTVVAHWIGGSGNWSSSANWDIGKVPNNSGGTNYDVVLNVLATNTTIIIDQSVTINSLSNADTVVIASGTNAISQWTINSGSIQMTGAVAQLTLSGSINNLGQITATTGTLYLTNATLTCTNTTSRVTANCPGSLTSVNLYASNGAIIAFTGATNYTSSTYGNTIQASGVGSRIDLLGLITLTGAGSSSYTTTIQALAGGEVDLAGQINGITVCTWDGVGSLINLGKVTMLNGVQLVANNGGVLVVPLTNHITWAGANSISASGVGSRVINQGLIAAAAAGCTITITDTNFTNVGQLAAANGGVIDINSTVTVNDPGWLAGVVSGTITIAGNLLGNTRNADQYAPLSEVRFDGAGSNAAPQLLEVMGHDLGATNAGFTHNFAYNTLSLANNTYVRLVDQSDNAPGAGAEALYVNSLIVPSGTTLDLNGLHLCARVTLISGTILGGVVTQIPDSGPIALAAPTPGSIGLAGELDEWTFYGRAGRSVTVVVNPGGSGSPAPLPPYLNWAMVKLLDATTNVLAMATNSSSGQIVTLNDVTLPADGNYRVQVRAAPQHSSSIGNYMVTVWDVTADVAALPLNQQRNGSIETPYAVDRWTFSAVAGQQIRFRLIMVSGPGVAFDLRRDSAPPSEYLFKDLTGNSDLITLTNSGSYTLTAHGTGGQYGTSYAFSMEETLQTSLPPGTTFNGTFSGSGQAQLFCVNVTNSGPLRMVLNGIPAGSRVELYAKLGAPPTRADYDYRSLNPSAGTLQLLVSLAPAGTWYFLVYADYVPVPGAYTLAPTTSGLILTGVTPSRHANNLDATLTLTGAGFDGTTTVALVATNGTNAASSVSVDSFTQITATFAANTVPAGIYSVRVSKPGGSDQLANAFQMIAGGQASLVTRLIVPEWLGYHAAATIYVEYSNTGDAAMPAPLLVLTATQNGQEGALLTLQNHRLVEGFWTSADPEGLSHSIQILASGDTPGVLQPGESRRVPVYYAGWQQPWNFSYPPMSWNLGVLRADDTTVVDWASLKGSMKPTTINTDAWEVVWANFTNQVGATWGDYVRMLDDNAAYLGQLGQRVVDVGQLLAFEFLQADGLSPLRTLASAVDAAVDAPGLPLVFSRFLPEPISQRFELGPFGRGWSYNWQYLLTNAADGTVTVLGPGGSRRVFQPDSRRAGSYFTQPGDRATLTPLGGSAFSLLEPAGLFRVFRADGKLDYVKDSNGNQITCGYSGNLLTSLTHSSGQSLQISYNGAGRIQFITDYLGRQTILGYDGTNEHLLSAQYYDGRTASYAYAGATASNRHALTEVANSCCMRRYFTYDAQGRLASTYRDGNTELVTFTHDNAGKVTVTDALANSSKFYFDHRGLLVKTEDALNNAVHLAFDDEYNLVNLTDPAGRSYGYAYDSNGNLTQSTDPLGHASRFTYHAAFNRLASVTDANGNATRYAYTGSGNLQSITYADSSRETWSYDPQGNPTSWVNRRSHSISYSYNGSGQLTNKVFADGSRAVYAHDTRGNLTNATTLDPGLSTLDYSVMSYDANDRLTNITSTGNKWLSFTYDTAGRRASSLDQLGHRLTYYYDTAGRLESMTNELGQLVVRYNYDAAGRLDRKTLGNGMVATYGYDAAGQLLTLSNRLADGTAISRFNYAYDTRGRRTAMATYYGTWTYDYDDLGQLTRAILSSTDPQIPSQDLTYVYDALGNRIRTIENGVTTEYTANNLNQYVHVGDTNYVFDADGNLIQETAPGGTTTYTYNDENRFVGVTNAVGDWLYVYDALGNRVATTESGTTTRYVIDPIGLGNVVGEYDGSGNLLAHFDHSLGLLSRTDAASNSAYYTFDAIGNAQQLVTAAGTIANRYAYAPFGALLKKTESIPNPFQFVGLSGVIKEQSGLDFMRARSFDSRSGHFLQADPINLLGGDLNLYSYAANNPLSLVDPSGLMFGSFRWPSLIPGLGWEVGGGWNSEHGSVVICGGVTASTPTVLPNVYVLMNQNGDVSGGISYGGFGASYNSGNRSWGPYWNVRGGGGGAPVVNLGNSGGSLGAGTVPSLSASAGGCVEIPLFPSATPVQSPTPPTSPGGSGNNASSGSGDPNAKIGPTGFGTNGFISLNSVMAYRIDFENETNATAPAQVVQVTDQLSTNLDWSMFQLTEIGFGDQLITIPPGSQYYETILPMSYNGVDFEVWIIAGIHLDSGEVYADFYSLDPETELPPNVLIGFLPPEDGTGRGMGHVSYTVLAKSGLPSGTQIRNVADVIFDQGEVIATNQRDPHNPGAGIDPAKQCLNTIDAGAPTSHVLPLPATTNVMAFLVQWTGQDDANGSGVQSYDLYVSDNSGPWTQWLTRTTNTSAIFTSQPSHTYGFYSVARDNVGNLEPARGSADALVTVIVPFPTLSITRTNNQVIVSWPLWAQGFQLESTARLASPAKWQTVTNMPAVVGGQYTVTLNVSGPGKFYRLNKSAPFPPLNILWITNKMVISWPQWAEGFQLQSTANLIPPMNWQAVTNAPVLIGDQYTVTLAAVGPGKFFRLALASISPRLSTGPINNQMAISWPQWAEGFFVESTASLVPSINWQPATNVPVFVSGRYILTPDVAGPSKFYRLSKP